MIQLDQAALRARFFTAFSDKDPQISWLGKPTVNPDESKPYGRFVIEPGANKLIEKGASKTYHQFGLVTFTVTIPKGQGTAVGYDMRDKFANLFRGYITPDAALRIGNSHDDIFEEPTAIKLRVRFQWESVRTA